MINILLGVVTVALSIYAMIGVAMSNMPTTKKMIWFAFVVLIPLIGPAVFFIVKPTSS